MNKFLTTYSLAIFNLLVASYAFGQATEQDVTVGNETCFARGGSADLYKVSNRKNFVKASFNAICFKTAHGVRQPAYFKTVACAYKGKDVSLETCMKNPLASEGMDGWGSSDAGLTQEHQKLLQEAKDADKGDRNEKGDDATTCSKCQCTGTTGACGTNYPLSGSGYYNLSLPGVGAKLFQGADQPYRAPGLLPTQQEVIQQTAGSANH